MPTDVENDTGGQVVAGSNPVSPTREPAGQSDILAAAANAKALPAGGMDSNADSRSRDANAYANRIRR